MEIQIKQTVKAGNSSAVILPRAWLNKDVRVELVKKTPEMILCDTLRIVKRYVDSKDIIGIYLTGSYARGEENADSDIDIMIITADTDKEIINEGIYHILIISKRLLKQKLEKDLFPIGQMIKEAKPLLNSDYIGQLEIKITEKNIKWYIETTADKLSLIEKIIEKAKKSNKKHLSDRVAYTLILRIRTLYIIRKLIYGEDYLNRDFMRAINNISEGKNAYERYIAVKSNLDDKNAISIEETERLYEYLKNQLAEIKKRIVRE